MVIINMTFKKIKYTQLKYHLVLKVSCYDTVLLDSEGFFVFNMSDFIMNGLPSQGIHERVIPWG